MPIHCCAMQGRMDAIQALLFFDTEESIKRNLEMESEVLKNDISAVPLSMFMLTSPNTSRIRLHSLTNQRAVKDNAYHRHQRKVFPSDWLKN